MQRSVRTAAILLLLLALVSPVQAGFPPVAPQSGGKLVVFEAIMLTT